MTGLRGSTVGNDLRDEYVLRGIFEAIGGIRGVYVTHWGDPLPKARARTGRTGKFYTPKRTKDAQEAVARALQFSMVKFEARVAVACLFHRQTHRRVDTDNLLKLVLDAGTKAGLWQDDHQVAAVAARVAIDTFTPRTVIAIGGYDEDQVV